MALQWVALTLGMLLIIVACGGGGGGAADVTNPISAQPSTAVTTVGTVVEDRTIWEYLTYEQQPSYTYAGVTYPPGPVSFLIQGHIAHDFWLDGNPDILIPINKAYASGVDTRFKPLIFKNTGTRFIEASNEVMNEMPSIPGIRRSYAFTDDIGSSGVFGVAHDTGDRDSADALFISSGNVPADQTLTSIPTLPLADQLGRQNAVDAHAMAGGDIDGDGLTDFIVGEWRATSGPYVLSQYNRDQWEVRRSHFLTSLLALPMVNPGAGEGGNLLLDLHLADLNDDGFDDLVAGFGHGSARSALFINDGQGGFSHENKRDLPESIYGVDNTLHLRTFSLDKDQDGDLDLLIIHSRYEPYYAGYTFQFLVNDGTGLFSDATLSSFSYLSEQHFLSGRLEWTDNFYLLDVNQDGELDIVGSDLSGVRLWLGRSDVSWEEVTVKTIEDHIGDPHIFVQMENGSVHALVFQQSWIDRTGTANKIWIDHVSLQGLKN